jgi:transcriptional regulator with XRE-family HTH domain
MPKRRTQVLMNFGPRLAALRKAAGYTQVEFAEEVGISQRVVAYYEAPTAHPPANLLPDMARALGISVDELLGTAPIKRAKRSTSSRLHRRIQEIEKLDARARRQIMQFLDTFIEREKLKQKVQAKQPA